MIWRAALVAAAIAAFTTTTGAPAAPHCDAGVETDPSNPALSPGPEDLFIGHRLLLTGAAGVKQREFADSRPGWLWLKVLAVVRGGRAVTLTVPRSERDRLRLRYGRDGSTVTLRPCTHSDEHWSYYPGGFVYSERACYALDIRFEGGRVVRRRIPLGVGATCAR